MQKQKHNWNWSVKHFILRIRFSKMSLFRMVLKRLKYCNTNFLMVWHELFSIHKQGCRKGGRNLKISAKKPVFLVSSGKNQISPLLAHRRKTFGKIHWWSPWKNSFRRPCTQACKMTPFLWKIVLYYTIGQHCSTTPIR